MESEYWSLGTGVLEHTVQGELEYGYWSMGTEVWEQG